MQRQISWEEFEHFIRENEEGGPIVCCDCITGSQFSTLQEANR